MILPERVLGSSGTTRICLGLAIGPSARATWSRNSAAMSSPGSGSSPRRIVNATMAWPVTGSVAPTTAASATRGCETSADSTSVVEMLCPETSMTSSTRPSSQMSPSESLLAPSPAKYIPSNLDQYVLMYRSSSPQMVRSMDGHGSLMTRKPPPPFGTLCPESSTTSAVIPGSGCIAAPGLPDVTPGSGLIMRPPVSVCHQVSTTGHRPPPMCWRYQL